MKNLIVQYFTLVQKQVPQAQMEAFAKKSGLNTQNISQIAKIVVAINSAFNTAILATQDTPEVFPKVFANVVDNNMKELGLDLNSLPKDLVFGVIEAILAISSQILNEVSENQP